MIYLASSWRNPAHDAVLQILKVAGLDVYNYRETNASFHWREIDPEWESWNFTEYLIALSSRKAFNAFGYDMAGLISVDTLILIEPSGISSHIELGWAVGRGLKVAIYYSEDNPNPELMTKMADYHTNSMMDLLDWLGVKD